jgi:hypothetical protein
MNNEDSLVFQKLREVSPVSIEVVDIRNDELFARVAGHGTILDIPKKNISP